MRQWHMCEACHGIATDSHHIISRGAGGPDDEWNRMWVCRRCHSEFHQLGWYEFAKRYNHARTRVVSARQRFGATTESRMEVR